MSAQIQADHFTKAIYALLDETFDNVQGYFLDKGTSMFETFKQSGVKMAIALLHRNGTMAVDKIMISLVI